MESGTQEVLSTDRQRFFARDESGTQEVFSDGSTRIFPRNKSGDQTPRNDGLGSRRQVMGGTPSLVENCRAGASPASATGAVALQFYHVGRFPQITTKCAKSTTRRV